MANGTSGSKGGRHRAVRTAFRYNPYEIGVCGGAPSDRAALMQALRTGPFAAMDVYCAANPAAETAYDAPFESLDADFALVPCAADAPMSKVAWIESERPAGIAEALCYVGRPAACPILPSSAAYFTTEQLDQVAAAILKRIAEQVAAGPLYGLVLAGGKSERMGRDKAAIDYHGQAQARHVFDMASRVCTRTWVSCRAEQQGSAHLAGMPVMADRFLDMGPMGGILSAMTAHPEVAWLVLACDLPFLSDETLQTLIAGRRPLRMATAFRGEDGFPEPLCTIYEAKSVHRLLRFLGLGYECPRKVLVNSPVALLDPPGGEALANANNPGEYAAARARLAGEAVIHG